MSENATAKGDSVSFDENTIEALMDEHDAWVPSVDVCSNCGDIYCDGTGCITRIDPNDEADHDALNQVQDRIRFGRAWQAMVRMVEAGVDWPTAITVADEALVYAGHRAGPRPPKNGGET